MIEQFSKDKTELQNNIAIWGWGVEQITFYFGKNPKTASKDATGKRLQVRNEQKNCKLKIGYSSGK